ncbi:unnamed protein product [Prorocentrum cordatum]|uniref:RRM domain-containing protein n=1 Tax=Prorocentrum cordatum TaxID=2364126 RepID=A0ABN9XAW6_9DINO|nr:unnamed protein product [Polarella glacialis]
MAHPWRSVADAPPATAEAPVPPPPSGGYPPWPVSLVRLGPRRDPGAGAALPLSSLAPPRGPAGPALGEPGAQGGAPGRGGASAQQVLRGPAVHALAGRGALRQRLAEQGAARQGLAGRRALQELEAGQAAPRGGAGLRDFTTVRLKGVMSSLTPQELVEVLNGSGCRSSFDFVFVPKDTKRGIVRGGSIAFVNFSNATAARDFCQRFHQSTLPGVSLPGVRLDVSPSNVQGFQANLDLRMMSEHHRKGLLLELCVL